MSKLAVALLRSLVVVAFLAGPVFADEEEEKLKKDLTAVIALHGQPCGEVVAVKVQAENDYAATCKDKHRYHVYLNPEGRVVVEQQK